MPDDKQWMLYGVFYYEIEKQINSSKIIQTQCLLCVKWFHKDMKEILRRIRNELLPDWGSGHMFLLKFTMLHILVKTKFATY